MKTPEAATGSKLAVLPSSGDGLTRKSFIDTTELLTLIPVCRRTLRNWMDAGTIPFCRMGGRILFHQESVEKAILRQQRGGGL